MGEFSERRVSGLPQPEQKLSPGSAGSPQAWHRAWREAPQWGQKAAEGFLKGEWQPGHSTLGGEAGTAEEGVEFPLLDCRRAATSRSIRSASRPLAVSWPE